MLRRSLKFLPGRHKIELGGQLFATLRQPIRFFVKDVALDLPPPAAGSSTPALPPTAPSSPS